MNKALVEICIPAIGECFDIFVPVDIPIKDLTRVIASGVMEITSGRYVSTEQEYLCLNAPPGLLNPALTLQDYDLKDGMQLYLI